MFTVDLYSTTDGSVPINQWLESLGSEKTELRILARLNRIASGNFGDVKPVGEGVWELRLHFGPGYRVYYSRVDGGVVLLLCGGDKSVQKRDIKTAKRYLSEFLQRTK